MAAGSDIPDWAIVDARGNWVGIKGIKSAVEVDPEDAALLTLDAPELRKAIAEALTELRQIETRVSELLGPLEVRIAALEERLAKSQP